MNGPWPHKGSQKQIQSQRANGSQFPTPSDISQSYRTTTNATAPSNAMMANVNQAQSPSRTQFPTYSIQQAYGRNIGAATPYNSVYQQYALRNFAPAVFPSNNPYAQARRATMSTSPPNNSQTQRTGKGNTSPTTSAQQSSTMGYNPFNWVQQSPPTEPPSFSKASNSPPSSTQQSRLMTGPAFIKPKLPQAAGPGTKNLEPPTLTLAHTHGPTTDSTTSSISKENQDSSQIKTGSPPPTQTQEQTPLQPQYQPLSSDEIPSYDYVDEDILTNSTLSQQLKDQGLERLRTILKGFEEGSSFERREKALWEWCQFTLRFYALVGVRPERLDDVWQIHNDYTQLWMDDLLKY